MKDEQSTTKRCHIKNSDTFLKKYSELRHRKWLTCRNKLRKNYFRDYKRKDNDGKSKKKGLNTGHVEVFSQKTDCTE